MTGTWWQHRRDQLLAEIARELAPWSEDELDDPGIGELADLLADAARQCTADAPGHPRTGRCAAPLGRAAQELALADRFLGGFLPLVVRHLHAALGLVREARAVLAAEPAALS
ncbi:hypothetical protein AB0D08_32090 [Kitasatospora sp. NPDC048540]|uniref:hypothetical protein n=1 Tax=unclassified Kitasatospora TaxID=2633591 RepID=UPI00053A5ACE|nr:hypothetical protein [Kitasatospora sp. MBT63]